MAQDNLGEPNHDNSAEPHANSDTTSNDKPTTLTKADVDRLFGRRPSRLREFALWTAIIIALIGGTAALVYSFLRKQPRNLVPDTKYLDEATEIEGYLVRPPLGYPKVDIRSKTGPPGARHFFWGGTKRADGTAPVFGVMLGTPPPNESHGSREQVFADFLGAFRNGHAAGWTSTAFSDVRINGIIFMHTKWSGINSNSGRKVHGFTYFAMDGKNAIFLFSQEAEPHHEEALKVSESAAASFKKK